MVEAIHRRLETRWLVPVKPGDTIRPAGEVKAKQSTEKSRWVTVTVEVTNQRGEAVASAKRSSSFQPRPYDSRAQASIAMRASIREAGHRRL